MSDLNTTALHESILQAGFTVNDEKSVIATNLNASILQALLMGLYTVIFGGTLYVYLTRRPSKHYLVPATMSMLYLSNLAAFSLQWYSTNLQFVANDTDMDTVFLATFDTQVAITTVLSILNTISLTLGDILLIWRCFNLWNRSVRIVFIPVFLAVAEAALMLSGAIADPLISVSDIPLQVSLNKASTAGILIAGCTTIITTALIAFRINSFLRNQDISPRKFRHVIDIVVQSGAIYSLTLIVFGVSTILDAPSSSTNLHMLIFNLWTSSFVFPLAGMSTTIIVARVVSLSSNIDPITSVHLTNIQFRPQSTARTGVDAISTHHNANINLADECSQARAPDSTEKITQEV